MNKMIDGLSDEIDDKGVSLKNWICALNTRKNTKSYYPH